MANVAFFDSGLVVEDIERYASDYYTRCAVVRPYPARTAQQTLALRQAVKDVWTLHSKDFRDAYDDGVAECVHALFRMTPATESKYLCSELAARLAREAGAWPEHVSVSVKIDDLARYIGLIETIF